MPQIVIKALDSVMAEHGKALADLGSKDATRLMTMALNRKGRDAAAKVHRALINQTGIKSHQIKNALANHKATAHNLRFEIVARGVETNLRLFMNKSDLRWKKPTSKFARFVSPSTRYQQVSAHPWAHQRTFPGVFYIPRWDKVYLRTSLARGPLRQVFGPNIAREMLIGESLEAFEGIMPTIVVEVGRLIDAKLGGMKLGGYGYTP